MSLFKMNRFRHNRTKMLVCTFLDIRKNNEFVQNQSLRTPFCTPAAKYSKKYGFSAPADAFCSSPGGEVGPKFTNFMHTRTKCMKRPKIVERDSPKNSKSTSCQFSLLSTHCTYRELKATFLRRKKQHFVYTLYVIVVLFL